MSRGAFRVRIIRAVTLGARRALPGATLDLDALSAAELVRTGAAVLDDEAALRALIDALPARWIRPATR